MGGALYAIGDYTTNACPESFVRYRNCEWVELPKRLRKSVPRAFFPLNGRLYIMSNGLDTCEMYEEAIGCWMIIGFAELNSIDVFALCHAERQDED